MKEELVQLIKPNDDDISAVRFDALMHGIELAHLAQKKYPKYKKDLLKKVKGIASVANIPEIQVQSELLDRILHTNYLQESDIDDFELIRKNLRDLIKYIPKTGKIYTTDFEDDILSVDWNESDLEKIIWNQLGTKQDYYSEVGEKPLGEFVREIVGLDMNAAKEAFSKYLDEREMNSNQIYFVNQIVEFIVRNGMMKDMSVLQESPFIDKGNVVELFGDNINLWSGIQGVINSINKNANYL